MGLRILHNDDDSMAIMYCGNTDWAFGPVFYTGGPKFASSEALHFIRWLRDRKGIDDPREIVDQSKLESYYHEWIKSGKPEC